MVGARRKIFLPCPFVFQWSQLINVGFAIDDGFVFQSHAAGRVWHRRNGARYGIVESRKLAHREISFLSNTTARASRKVRFILPVACAISVTRLMCRAGKSAAGEISCR